MRKLTKTTLVLFLALAGCYICRHSAEGPAAKELFGVRLLEPFGGDLKVTEFPGAEAGASYVSEWMEAEDCPKVKYREYFYRGEDVFDAKEAWRVHEFVDRENGDVVELTASTSFSTNTFNRRYEKDGVAYNGYRLLCQFIDELGADCQERYLDGQHDEVVPCEGECSGRLDHEFRWTKGGMLIVLALQYDDFPADMGNGSIEVDVVRMDLLQSLQRDGSFRASFHEFESRDEDSGVSLKWRIKWPESLSGLDDSGLQSVRREILQMAFGPAWRYLDNGGKAWTPPATIVEAEDEIKRESNDSGGLVFSAEVELDWPFGKSGQDGAAWHEKPVLVVKNSGSAGLVTTCGCRYYTVARTFGLPDGRELTVDDYFDAAKIERLSALVRRRILEGLPFDDAALKNGEREINLRDRDAVYMRVMFSGVCFYFAPNTVFPPYVGVTKVFLKWGELSEFRKELRP